MRPILLLLLVVMIALAIWLSFGRVQARSEFVDGEVAPPNAPVQVLNGSAQLREDDVSPARAESALIELIGAHEPTGATQVRFDEAEAILREALLPRTLESLRARFADAYIALRSSGLSEEAALARLADLERDALAVRASAIR